MPIRSVTAWWMHLRGVMNQIEVVLVLRGPETVLAWLFVFVHRYELDWRSRMLRQAPDERYVSCYRTRSDVRVHHDDSVHEAVPVAVPRSLCSSVLGGFVPH